MDPSNFNPTPRVNQESLQTQSGSMLPSTPKRSQSFNKVLIEHPGFNGIHSPVFHWISHKSCQVPRRSSPTRDAADNPIQRPSKPIKIDCLLCRNPGEREREREREGGGNRNTSRNDGAEETRQQNGQKCFFLNGNSAPDPSHTTKTQKGKKSNQNKEIFQKIPARRGKKNPRTDDSSYRTSLVQRCRL